MSSMKRFPPAKARGEPVTAAARGGKRLQKVMLTVNVADADDLKERQKQQHPAGDKLVHERHPVDSCLLTHKHTPQRVRRLTSEEELVEDKPDVPWRHTGGPGGRG